MCVFSYILHFLPSLPLTSNGLLLMPSALPFNIVPRCLLSEIQDCTFLPLLRSYSSFSFYSNIIFHLFFILLLLYYSFHFLLLLSLFLSSSFYFLVLLLFILLLFPCCFSYFSPFPYFLVFLLLLLLLLLLFLLLLLLLSSKTRKYYCMCLLRVDSDGCNCLHVSPVLLQKVDMDPPALLTPAGS